MIKTTDRLIGRLLCGLSGGLRCWLLARLSRWV